MTNSVARAALFVLTLLGLAASGWMFVHNGFALHKGGTVSLLSSTATMDAELEAAATMLLQARVSVGTYAYTDLRHFRDLALVRADETSFCIQVGVGADARHLAGPGGYPAPGPC